MISTDTKAPRTSENSERNNVSEISLKKVLMERFHSNGQHLCKFIGTKEGICIRKEFDSQRTGLGHQHGDHFIVLGHQYSHRDVMWKHSIKVESWKDAIIVITFVSCQDCMTKKWSGSIYNQIQFLASLPRRVGGGSTACFVSPNHGRIDKVSLYYSCNTTTWEISAIWLA